MNKYVNFGQLESCLTNAPDGHYPIRYEDFEFKKDYLYTRDKVRVKDGIIDLDSVDLCCKKIIEDNEFNERDVTLESINFLNYFFEVEFDIL